MNLKYLVITGTNVKKIEQTRNIQEEINTKKVQTKKFPVASSCILINE